MRNPLVSLCICLIAVPAFAGADSMEDRLSALEEKIRAQAAEIERLSAEIGDSRSSEVDELIERLAESAPEPGSSGLRASFEDTLRFRDRAGHVDLKIGGRLNLDWSWFRADRGVESEFGPFENGVGFRRARMYASGVLYGNLQFKAEFDFAGGDADFKDVWMGIRQVPIIETIRIGHQKEPMSLEQMESGSALTFLERSLMDSLVPGRNVGVLLAGGGFGNRVSYSGGIFTETDDQGSGGEGWAGTARVTGTPWFEENGLRLLHVGASASWRNPDDGGVAFSARPEAQLAPRVLRSGDIPADSLVLIGAEAALVLGPVFLQSEYLRCALDAPAMGDPVFHGFYVTAGWFITGENRPYAKGTFQRVVPLENLTGDGGVGALELAVRWSRLDLDSGDVRGGTASALSVGASWYLNPAFRVLADCVATQIRGVGRETAFLVRLQLDF